MNGVVAIANDPNGTRRMLKAVAYQDGHKQTKALITFNTPQARTAIWQIEKQRVEIEHRSQADHERVLMTFTQSNVKDSKIGSRTGERVVIEAISERDLPLVYASDLAEQRIKHEIREADENVFKKRIRC